MPRKFLNGIVSDPAIPWIGPPPALDCWHSPARAPGGGTQALAVDTMVLIPIPLPAMTLQSVQLEVTTLGASGVLRCGLYAHDYTAFKPVLGSLIADFGSQSSATTGAKLFSTSAVVPYGISWLAVVAQVAACTVRASSGGHGLSNNLLLGESPGVNNSRNSCQVLGVSGALPTTGTLQSTGTTDPKVFFRRSATV